MPAKTTKGNDPRSEGKQATTNKKNTKDTGTMIPSNQKTDTRGAGPSKRGSNLQ